VRLIAAADQPVAVDRQRRTITGTFAPFGEPGRTNLGPRKLRASAVQLAPIVLGTYGHGDEWGADRGPVVARLVASRDDRGRRARILPGQPRPAGRPAADRGRPGDRHARMHVD
jgi:hypothetical protein